jgi:CubicO group peptidase (beta-lactamase class C family)
MKQTITTLLFLAIFLFNAFGQTSQSGDTLKHIEKYLADLDKAGLNAAVLVELNETKVISKGYGYSDLENKIKITPATIFDIGSVTKQFTATAILRLEREGKLKVQDSISRYFDNVPADKQNITLHDLLRHQSGLQSNVGGDFEKITAQEFVSKVMQSPLKFETGKRFSYSNIGYSLLAMIIEKVSGQSYETYLYENLWKPAQMEQTGYTRPSFDKNQIAIGYFRNDSAWGKPNEKEWDKTAPYWHLLGNGGVLSTLDDMYKWHQALAGEQILTGAEKYKLYHPVLRNDEDSSRVYAYGWDVAITKRNTTQVWHNGTNHIFYADILRYPDEGIALIMLSNKSHPNFGRLTYELSKIIFNPGYSPEIPIQDNKRNFDFTNRIIHIIKEQGLEKAKSAYQKKVAGEQLLEYLMREEGFNHIDNHKPEIAMQIFEMNLYAYPHSANALQGLGEGYMETGNKEQALKYFRQSLSIRPDNSFVTNMIKRLEEVKN